jgi:hypothetical protein
MLVAGPAAHCLAGNFLPNRAPRTACPRDEREFFYTAASCICQEKLLRMLRGSARSQIFFECGRARKIFLYNSQP